MSDLPPFGSRSDSLENDAARWVWRRDRGLTAAEQDQFSQWLAASPRHREEFARLQGHWQRTHTVAEWRPEHGQPNPDLLAPADLSADRTRRRRLTGWVAATVPLAAAVAFFFFISRPRAHQTSGQPEATMLSASVPTIERRILEDGSIVQLNRGSIVSVLFTPAERRVTLERGEAHFIVEKNPNRPFIVTANSVSVRAVGTAFDVRLDPTTVDVLVTEGRVQVRNRMKTPGAAGPVVSREIPIVEAGQRAVVPIAPAAVPSHVVSVSPEEIDRFLAWQPRILDFTAAPLSAIVAEFNRHNPVAIVIADPEIASLKISATFPSDNVDGFVRLLEAGFKIQAERRGESEIILRKAP